MNNVYVVSTPIGNISDITLRAIEILKSVEAVFAEDTRITLKLFRKYNIKTKLISLNKWNELQKYEQVKKLLENGNIAIVSDAGTPTISDPGQFIISKLVNDNINIISIPGPSSIISALSISGLKYNSFQFIGFIPRQENKLKLILENTNSDLIVSFESSKRINRTIVNLFNINPNIKVVIAREITKKFEEVIIDRVSNLLNKEIIGEIVLIIKVPKIIENDNLSEKIKFLMKEGMNNRTIIEYLTNFEKQSKNKIYKEIKNV